MSYDKLDADEKIRRRELVAAARKMIIEQLSVENEDEVSLNPAGRKNHFPQ